MSLIAFADADTEASGLHEKGAGDRKGTSSHEVGPNFNARTRSPFGLHFGPILAIMARLLEGHCFLETLFSNNNFGSRPAW